MAATLDDILKAFNDEEKRRADEAAAKQKKKDEVEDPEKLRGNIIQVLREVQTYSPKAFDLVFRGNDAAGIKAFFGSMLAISIAALAGTPIGWVTGIVAVLGLIYNLVFNHPSRAITDSQRLRMLDDNLNGLTQVINADWIFEKRSKLGEVISKNSECVSRVQNVYMSYPDRNKLFPWRKGSDADDETLFVQLLALNQSIFNNGSRVWFSIFLPENMDKAKMPWMNFLSRMVPINTKVPAPPVRQQIIFDARVSIDVFVEYAGTLLMMMTLRTPQYRSLGIYSKYLQDLVATLDFLIVEYEKVYYFNSYPYGYYSTQASAGTGLPGDTGPYLVLAETGPIAGAVHPGMGIGITAIAQDKDPWDHKVKQLPADIVEVDGVYIDEYSKNKLLEMMGVPTLKKLRENLSGLSRPPEQSETIIKGATLNWKNLWSLTGQKVNVKVGALTFSGERASRACNIWQDCKVMPQRKTEEFTDIPQIKYSYFLESNHDKKLIPIEPGTHDIKIKTDCYNTLFTTKTNFANADEDVYFKPNRYIDVTPALVYETAKEINISYTLDIIPDTGFQFRIHTDQNTNGIVSLVVRETLPIEKPIFSNVPPDPDFERFIQFDTRFEFYLIGNMIVVPDELYEYLIGLMIHHELEMSKLQRELPFKLSNDIFKSDPFHNPDNPDYYHPDFTHENLTAFRKDLDSIIVNKKVNFRNM